MSVAWTTILIIALLLPGVFFLTGFAARERHAREIVRSNVISDVAWALLAAIALHILFVWILQSAFGFNLEGYFAPLANFDRTPQSIIWERIAERIPGVSLYVLVTALVALGAGYLAAGFVVSGYLRFMATHKWIYDVVRAHGRKRMVVTAYVMTRTIENNRALMYKGLLQEFYLTAQGQFSYIVLRNCTKFYMDFTGEAPKTGEQLSLFKSEETTGAGRIWNYLMIDGSNVANILFDPSPVIRTTDRGNQALQEAIKTISRDVAEASLRLQAEAVRRAAAAGERTDPGGEGKP